MKVSVVGPVNVDAFVRGSAPLDRDALHEWVDLDHDPPDAVLSDGTRMIHQPAVPLSAEETAESVGAGDAFDAGLVTALLSGVDLAEAAGRATATAAVTLAGVGGSATVTPEAVEEMRARVPDPVER